MQRKSSKEMHPLLLGTLGEVGIVMMCMGHTMPTIGKGYMCKT
jgi:hypothetical protein